MAVKNKKTVKGRVVSAKMDKSIVLLVEFYKVDKHFKKFVKKSKKIMAHDAEGRAGEGDLVIVEEGIPFSKSKRHRLLEVVEKKVVV